MDKIKIKLGDLVAAESALATLSAAKIPVKASFHIGRVARRARDELKLYHEKKNALVTEFGTPILDADKNPVPGAMEIGPTSENWEQFTKQIDELVAIEIEIDAKTISINEFGTTAELAPQDLDALHWLITE